MGDNYNYEYSKRLESASKAVNNFRQELKIKNKNIDDLIVVVNQLKDKYRRQKQINHKVMKENKDLKEQLDGRAQNKDTPGFYEKVPTGNQAEET